jgi:hypothetical protein
MGVHQIAYLLLSYMFRNFVLTLALGLATFVMVSAEENFVGSFAEPSLAPTPMKQSAAQRAGGMFFLRFEGCRVEIPRLCSHSSHERAAR